MTGSRRKKGEKIKGVENKGGNNQERLYSECEKENGGKWRRRGVVNVRKKMEVSGKGGENCEAVASCW